MNHPSIGRAVGVLVIHLGVTVAAASTRVDPLLDPATYASPSGRFELYVDPSSRWGDGPARYRFTRDGEEVWSGERPYTLWEAGVTDEGRVGGYAYSTGRGGWGGTGTFRVLILDSRGRVILEDAFDRVYSRAQSGRPEPEAWGMLVHGGNDRLYVLLWEHHDPNPWWIWCLSTGERLPDVVPEELMPQVEKVDRHLREARELPGTELSLLHWWVNDHRGFHLWNYPEGGEFALVRSGGEPVWILDRPRDYTVPRDKRADNRLGHLVKHCGAILDVGADGRFSLWFVQEEQRVDFRAVLDAGTSTGWRVEETGRSDYAPSLPHIASVPPRIELERLARVGLVSSGLIDPGPATVDHLGRALVQDLDTGCVHVFDRGGRRLLTCETERGEFRSLKSINRLAVDREGGIYVELNGLPMDGYPDRHLGFDPEGRRIGPTNLGDDVVVFQPAADGRWITSMFGGWIAHLGPESQFRGMIQRRADGRWLRKIDDCAAGPDGSLVVLDEPRHPFGDWGVDLALYDPEGRGIAVIPLPDPITADRVALSRDWAWVGTFGPEGTLVKRSDRSLRYFVADPSEGPRSAWTFGFSPDGQELWGIERRGPTLHRFALPDE